MPHLLAIDQGTTSSRAILFDTQGTPVATSQRELELSYPASGWVEQSAPAIWRDTLACCRDVFAQTGLLEDTVAIGITNQRETTVLWDRHSGEPVHPAIVWQDRRTAERCAELREQGWEPEVSHRSGLLLDPYFSATKLAWLLDNVERARDRAIAGDLAFGTIDSFLLWHLTGGQVHATDASNASRTGLFNIHTQQWDEQLLSIFGIPDAVLPEVRDSACHFGDTLPSLFGRPVAVTAILGDQHAAMAGQACFEKGSIKSTYGTGCFMLMHTGEQPVASAHRMLTTMAYRVEGQPSYALEGSIFVAGAAVQWLRDGLQLFSDAADTEAMARSVADAGGVFFVPALTGLGAPYWNPDARGLISGLSRGSTKAHLVRATLEAQAYQSRDLIVAMQADAGVKPGLLRVDGGLVANDFVCQFLADQLDASIDVPAVAEATAWGAASFAGLQAGVFDGLDTLAGMWRCDRRYQAQMPREQADELYRGWLAAVEMLTN